MIPIAMALQLLKQARRFYDIETVKKSTQRLKYNI